MALGIVVRLRDGRYDAGGVRPSRPEWPPHPARVFCALVAGAREEADFQALRWLEAAGSPQVWASPDVQAHRVSGYVVTNDIVSRGGSQTWLARTSDLRSRSSVFPGSESFAMVWPQVQADEQSLARLEVLARRVPYVGRSTSTAEVTVTEEPVLRRAWQTYVPTTLDRRGADQLRVPFPGYVDALESAFADGRRAWEVARSVPYAIPSEHIDETSAVTDSPYTDLVVFGVRRPSVPVAGDRTVEVAGMMRKAVMLRVADPLPPQVSGHGADGRPHVGFFPLLDVGHQYADGHLLGVAVGIPRGMTAPERAVLLRGLLEPPIQRLTVGSKNLLWLDYQPDRTEPRGLLPERWTAENSGASRWESATPLMLDRFPRKTDQLAELVCGATQRAGFPRPAHVEVTPAPPVRGGLRRPRAGTLPGYAHRPLVHARITFDRPVRGPLAVGAMRYLGLGLFIPANRESA